MCWDEMIHDRHDNHEEKTDEEKLVEGTGRKNRGEHITARLKHT